MCLYVDLVKYVHGKLWKIIDTIRKYIDCNRYTQGLLEIVMWFVWPNNMSEKKGYQATVWLNMGEHLVGFMGHENIKDWPQEASRFVLLWKIYIMMTKNGMQTVKRSVASWKKWPVFEGNKSRNQGAHFDDFDPLHLGSSLK